MNDQPTPADSILRPDATEISAAPVLDSSAGLLSTGGDPELLNELIAIFLQTIPGQLAILERAIDCGNPATAAREVHSLKGAAGALGATRIRELAVEIEARTGHDDLETVRPLIDEIQSMVTRLRQEHASGLYLETPPTGS
jgi:HPt (histidine-containing phosphotransfer) domain-containing protein